ncbi:hypothetical protein E1301_Tti015867 [Triplophysa tibetana]|uniref:Uncharacterized protein n=1 Tax=Triplophysa tibetana TaxID=1572043 RepID=A0A5A9PHF1_9TELE|nr:hypothetical protein E1301_Tti015867 [Triplophysa tibetana]
MPSEWKKFCKDDVKPCQHCVPSPMLKIIVPPDSSGSTVPQIAATAQDTCAKTWPLLGAHDGLGLNQWSGGKRGM